MPPLFHLPLGHPDSTLSDAARRQYLEEFRLALTLDPIAFSPSRPFRSFTLNTGIVQIDEFVRLYALWDGYATIDGDRLLLEIAPSRYDQLQRADYREVPIPKYARYGPVANSPLTASRAVRRGEYLGDLSVGEAFHCELLDEHSYYLDPLYFFSRWHEAGLWDIPHEATLPYLSESEITELLIAGPNLLGPNDAYLRISGGSRPFTVLNPAAELDPIYFSFLSNDTLRIEAANLTGPTQLRIEDVSDVMYRNTTPGEFTFDLSAVLDWAFTPQENLKPKHKKYVRRKKNKPGNGKRTPGEPLSYEIRIGSGASTLTTTIRQDTKDVIRQEYLFHSRPLQPPRTGRSLTVPPRRKIELNRFGSKNFSTKEIQTSNYQTRHNNWVLNAEETLQVAEYIRALYKANVIEGQLANEEEFSTVKTFGLSLNSSWRNPERNEAVGGARTSNHQDGKAIDLKSVHRGGINNNANNVGAFWALFQAGRTFLEQLIALNGAAATERVEIFLERGGSTILWKYQVINGELRSIQGSSYGNYGSNTPQNEVDAIKQGARYATHVHISWNSKPGDTALELPVLNEAPDIPPLEPELKNIIIIATEDDAVPAEDQLPLNYCAESLAQYLTVISPAGVETEIHRVANTLDFLKLCNAFGTQNYRINYFFSFSHAWENGLVLRHYPKGTNAETLKDPVFLEEINRRYGYPPDEDIEGADYAISQEYTFTYGSNDFTEIMPHQIRISNLIKLPELFRTRMRRHFANSKGIFLVGCNTANEDVGPISNFCEVFATVVDRIAYGAFYSSFIFVPNGEGGWMPAEISRLTLPEELPGEPVILIPGKYGIGSLLGYMWNRFPSLPPILPDIPEIPDLIPIYKTMLTPCFPQSVVVTP